MPACVYSGPLPRPTPWQTKSCGGGSFLLCSWGKGDLGLAPAFLTLSHPNPKDALIRHSTLKQVVTPQLLGVSLGAPDFPVSLPDLHLVLSSALREASCHHWH